MAPPLHIAGVAVDGASATAIRSRTWQATEFRHYRFIVEAASAMYQLCHERVRLNERTFAWIDQNRRMSENYETLPGAREAFIYLAVSHSMVRRYAPHEALEVCARCCSYVSAGAPARARTCSVAIHSRTCLVARSTFL